MKREETAKEVWKRVQKKLKRVLTSLKYSWFTESEGIELKNNILIVKLKDDIFKDMIEKFLSNVIIDTLEQLGYKDLKVSFIVEKKKKQKNTYIKERILYRSDYPALRKDFSFDNFVVGSSNDLAYHSAFAVSNKPGKTYNPLLIYGGTGLGKTHLMQAIGNRLLEIRKRINIIYVTVETFLIEFIEALSQGKSIDFKNKYRKKDVLLLDDIHFLEGKERLQEELFNTFNSLQNAGKQIVLTSDRPPREIPTLHDRLRSRFVGGMVAEIQPPELETRIAILKKKALMDGINIDDEVAFFIANRVKSNIKELEGALIRLLAFSSIHNKPPDMEMAKEVLSGFFSSSSVMTDTQIISIVAKDFSLKPEEITGAKRTKTISRARHIAMYLLREIKNRSLKEIGKLFNGRDHSTVIYSISKIENDIKNDTELYEKIIHIKKRING